MMRRWGRSGNGSARIRTENQGIMSPLENPENTGKSGHSAVRLSRRLSNEADSDGLKWPGVDAEPDGGIDGALARLADGTRRLCGE
jgi:hypothetical protein